MRPQRILRPLFFSDAGELQRLPRRADGLGQERRRAPTRPSARASFVDADAEIERRTGVDISYIFEREGEPGFRQREAAVIDELSSRAGIVLATGGGAVLDPRTRDRLRERGRVVYLRASVNQQLMRTRHSSHRPLLANPTRAAPSSG
jgi:shikimate kinase